MDGDRKAGFGAQCWGALRLRCPRCLRGQVFRGLFAMNDPCPECGLIFQREEGYFLGAMYVSYVLACGVITGLFLFAQWLLPEWGPIALFFVVSLLYVPLIPPVFRYSRVLWIYFERLGAPGDVSATSFEKMRRREFDRAARPR
jgi:uncharacterized protein (DUF983 family)